jgi:hypothetical protein
MKCFTPSECSEWLRKLEIVEAPYSLDNSAEAYAFQFEPPSKPGRLTAFMRALFDAFGEFPGALLVFDDWSLYHPDEMAIIESLRRGHGEHRHLIDAPGHLFTSVEVAEAIGHCYLALMYGWSAYLYILSGAATVLFWEGDLVDIWSADEKVRHPVRAVIQTYELRLIHDHVS